MEQTCHKRRTSKCARRGPTGWMCSAGPSNARRPPLRSVRIRFGLFRFCLTLVFFWGWGGGASSPPPSPHLEDPHARLRAPRARPCAAATHGARGAAGPAPCPAVPAALGAHESCRPGLVPGGPARGPALCSFPAPPPPGVRPLRGDAPRPRRRNAARAILVGCGRRAGNGAEDGGGR